MHAPSSMNSYSKYPLPTTACLIINTSARIMASMLLKTIPTSLRVFEQSLQAVFGNSFLSMGQSASIPFMNFLRGKWPAAKFVVTGILGPESNAHGLNEFLNVEYLNKLTACFSQIIARSILYSSHMRRSLKSCNPNRALRAAKQESPSFQASVHYFIVKVCIIETLIDRGGQVMLNKWKQLVKYHL